MDTIFENYEQFLSEHSDEVGSPQGVVRMFTDDGMYRAYADSLVEGLDSNRRNSVLAVMNRQRQMILAESANVPASAFASGWSVMS